jgi:hypothetical protein
VERYQLPKPTLIKVGESKDAKFVTAFLDRVSELLLPDILADYQSRYFSPIDSKPTISKQKTPNNMPNENEPLLTKNLNVVK